MAAIETETETVTGIGKNMCNCAEIAVLIPGITIFQRKAYHSIPKDHHHLKNFAFHVPKLQSNFFIHCDNYLLKKVETKFLSE